MYWGSCGALPDSLAVIKGERGMVKERTGNREGGQELIIEMRNPNVT